MHASNAAHPSIRRSRFAPPARGRYGAWLVALGALLSACGGSDTAPAADPGYLQARQTWQAQGIQDYRYTLQVSCFCVSEGPVAVTVRNGVAVSASYVNTGLPVPSARLAALPTLDGLYELADRAYAQNAVVIRYAAHPRLGYLESLYIDYSAQVADEEVGYTVATFERGTF